MPMLQAQSVQHWGDLIVGHVRMTGHRDLVEFVSDGSLFLEYGFTCPVCDSTYYINSPQLDNDTDMASYLTRSNIRTPDGRQRILASILASVDTGSRGLDHHTPFTSVPLRGFQTSPVIGDLRSDVASGSVLVYDGTGFASMTVGSSAALGTAPYDPEAPLIIEIGRSRTVRDVHVSINGRRIPLIQKLHLDVSPVGGVNLDISFEPYDDSPVGTLNAIVAEQRQLLLPFMIGPPLDEPGLVRTTAWDRLLHSEGDD